MNENPTNAKEQYELGRNYMYGENGLSKDDKNAYYWYTKAAEQNHGEAMYMLGFCYGNGRGISKDLTKAKHWEAEAIERLTDAANKGDADASCRLGYAYNYALWGGVSKDDKEAEKWYDRAKKQLSDAAKQGDAVAKYKLGKLYESNVPGIPINREEKVRLYKEAAEQGNADAQCGLADSYQFGLGVPKNEDKAIFWYTKAAEQGSDRGKKGLEAFKSSKKGCYVATCVYGSYNCPQVWTLRRYRDSRLSKSWFGRRFIRVYYAVSPTVVGLFGDKKWFNGLCKPIIDSIVRKLQNSGIGSDLYSDV